MPRVLVTPPMLIDTPGPYSEILEKGGFEIVYPTDVHSLKDKPALIAQLEGIDAIIASMEPFDREVLSVTNLRAIARMGVGFDAIDIPAATEFGVAVTITPGAVEESVAELTIALIYGVYRDLVRRDHQVRLGDWQRKAMPRLWGKTLGLIGMGRIGKTIVPRAQGIGLNIIAYDPFPDKAFAQSHNIEFVSLDELLGRADVVSLHLPSNAETENIINAETLAKMKQGSVLINTSRGATVDEDALCESLRGGHLLGAGIDVFHEEPLSVESPLTQLDNIVLCTHMGGLDQQSQIDMSSLAAQCLVDLHKGQWPEVCVVNKDLTSAWQW